MIINNIFASFSKISDTAYGIDGDSSVMFLSREAAEDCLLKYYPEYCSNKDVAHDFCEQMIWEETKISLGKWMAA